MSKDRGGLVPNPAYKDYPGVFPDPYQRASGTWAMRYRIKTPLGVKTVTGEPGTEEFNDSYQAMRALIGQAEPDKDPVKFRKLVLQPGETGKGRSLDWLIGVYFASPDYEDLGARVRKEGGWKSKAGLPQNQQKRRDYLSAFANARTTGGRRFGNGPYEGIEQRHVELWLNTIKPVGRYKGLDGKIRGHFTDGSSVRDAHLAAVRKLYSWARKSGLTKVDPCEFIERKYVAGGHLPPSDDALARFRKRWERGTMARLAFALFITLGLRRSDVIELGNHLMEGNVLRLKPTKNRGSKFKGKSSKEREFVLPPDLMALIKQTTAQVERETGIVPFPGSRDDTWLRNASGRKFGYGDISKRWRQWCKAAGFKASTKPHSMRAAHAIEVYRQKRDIKAVQAALGHANVATTEIYLRSLNLDLIANEARVGLVAAM